MEAPDCHDLRMRGGGGMLMVVMETVKRSEILWAMVKPCNLFFVTYRPLAQRFMRQIEV
jgi:hypothetical protein